MYAPGPSSTSGSQWRKSTWPTPPISPESAMLDNSTAPAGSAGSIVVNESTAAMPLEPTVATLFESTAATQYEPTVATQYEPTVTALLQPTATATYEPKATAQLEPTTAAPFESTATAPFEPTATAPSEPTANASSEPTANASSEPTANASSEPTAAMLFEPAATASFEPAATAPFAPTATAPFEPAATAPFVPTATAPFEPTAAAVNAPGQPTFAAPSAPSSYTTVFNTPYGPVTVTVPFAARSTITTEIHADTPSSAPLFRVIVDAVPEVGAPPEAPSIPPKQSNTVRRRCTDEESKRRQVQDFAVRLLVQWLDKAWPEVYRARGTNMVIENTAALRVFANLMPVSTSDIDLAISIAHAMQYYIVLRDGQSGAPSGQHQVSCADMLLPHELLATAFHVREVMAHDAYLKINHVEKLVGFRVAPFILRFLFAVDFAINKDLKMLRKYTDQMFIEFFGTDNIDDSYFIHGTARHSINRSG